MSKLKEDLVNANVFGIEANTNGFPDGNSSSHDFSLVDLGGTQWSVEVTDKTGKKHTMENPKKIKVLLNGDGEVTNITNGFYKFYKFFSKEIGDPEYIKTETLVDDVEYASSILKKGFPNVSEATLLEKALDIVILSASDSSGV